jgi:hypothetical protein
LNLVKVGLGMVVGGLVGVGVVAGVIAYFGPSNPSPLITLADFLVLVSLYGGILLLGLLALRSIISEWGSGSKSQA